MYAMRRPKRMICSRSCGRSGRALTALLSYVNILRRGVCRVTTHNALDDQQRKREQPEPAAVGVVVGIRQNARYPGRTLPPLQLLGRQRYRIELRRWWRGGK